MAGIARVQAQRRNAAKLDDEPTQNTEAQGAVVEGGTSPATIETESPYLGYWVDSANKRMRYRGEKHLLTFGSPGTRAATPLRSKSRLIASARSC